MPGLAGKVLAIPNRIAWTVSSQYLPDQGSSIPLIK